MLYVNILVFRMGIKDLFNNSYKIKKIKLYFRIRVCFFRMLIRV